MFGLLDRLSPTPTVKVSTAAQIEMTAMRRGDDLVVHLVNHSGREILLGGWYPLTEYMPVVRNIGVAIRLPDHADGHRLEPMLEPSHEPLVATTRDGYAHVNVEELEFMQSVVLEGYFAAIPYADCSSARAKLTTRRSIAL
jgi:hypothetical protein